MLRWWAQHEGRFAKITIYARRNVLPIPDKLVQASEAAGRFKTAWDISLNAHICRAGFATNELNLYSACGFLTRATLRASRSLSCLFQNVQKLTIGAWCHYHRRKSKRNLADRILTACVHFHSFYTLTTGCNPTMWSTQRLQSAALTYIIDTLAVTTKKAVAKPANRTQPHRQVHV